MARKKRNRNMWMPPYEPDPKAMRRSASEHLARTFMETHPRTKAVRNLIVEEVEKAANRAISKKSARGRG